MVVEAWLVFVVAFLACALTLGPLMLAPELRAHARSRPTAPPPAQPPDRPLGEGPARPLGGLDDDDDADAADSETLRQSRMRVLKFLERSLGALCDRGARLDGFTRFGCNLYLAGGCEIVAHSAGLSHKQTASVLAAGVRALGANAETAARFSDKYDEYLLEPKYIRMFKAGRDAMERFLGDGAEAAAAAFAKALERWTKTTADDDHADGPTTVVFTDIVGSTRMNQTLGDAAAQLVVRAHNDIVRAALDQYEGTEVKHTGDGIMAAFKNTANAVETCIEIQRDCAAHNAADPDHPLAISIGVNAGEPIAEDGDLFGATVQLAARICDRARGGQVLASSVVRELCAGKLIRFKRGSDYEMKGIEDLVSTFEVVLEPPEVLAEMPAAVAALG